MGATVLARAPGSRWTADVNHARYPGSAARLAEFKQKFPQAQSLGRPVPSADQPPGHVPAQPWLVMTGDTHTSYPRPVVSADLTDMQLDDSCLFCMADANHPGTLFIQMLVLVLLSAEKDSLLMRLNCATRIGVGSCRRLHCQTALAQTTTFKKPLNLPTPSAGELWQ